MPLTTMCAHTAKTAAARHIRRGRQHICLLIGLLNHPKSGVSGLVKGMAVRRCEAPLGISLPAKLYRRAELRHIKTEIEIFM